MPTYMVTVEAIATMVIEAETEEQAAQVALEREFPDPDDKRIRQITQLRDNTPGE